MSEELERVYTINLGKVLLSQPQHRAVRALNMIREFARRHMKTQRIKIDEELARQVWSRGARSPPRKIRVRMSRTDIGDILVERYDGPHDDTSQGADAPAIDGTEGASAAGVIGSGTAGAAETPSLPEPKDGPGDAEPVGTAGTGDEYDIDDDADDDRDDDIDSDMRVAAADDTIKTPDTASADASGAGGETADPSAGAKAEHSTSDTPKTDSGADAGTERTDSVGGTATSESSAKSGQQSKADAKD